MAVDMGGCVNYGVASLKKDYGFHILSTLIIGLINSCTGGLLIGPLLVGYWMGIEKLDKGEKPAINDLFAGFSNFMPSFLAGLLGMVIVSIGLLLCVIPGFLVTPIVPLAIYLCLRGETDGVRALKRAWNGLKANLGGLVLACLVLQLIASLGVIACIVGVLLTAPIAMAGMYKMAQQVEADCRD